MKTKTNLKVKPKRIKKVFSKAGEVLHLWANQSQEYARQAGKINRVFFEGKSAYSYGRHYELGRIMTYKGIECAVVNNSGYSHTTGNHIRYAESALDGLMPYVSASTFDVKQALLEVQGKLVDTLMKVFSATKFYKGFRYDAESYYTYGVAEFNKTAKALKHAELCIDITPEFVALANEHVQRRLARQLELSSPEAELKREQARIKRAELELKKNQASVDAWKLGGPFTEFIRFLHPVLIRIHGDVVQTSNGASVPLNEARVAFRNIMADDAAPGMPVGPYRFDSFENGVIKIGCHTFRIDDVKAVLENSRHLKVV